MSVLYENTLSPRIQSLLEEQNQSDGPIVVDISESPIRLTQRLCAGRDETDPVFVRARHLREILRREMSDQQWDDYAEKAATTKTVLSPVGRTAAVRLVRLGYLGTAVACHAHFETAGIEAVPNERWFQEFVDNKLSDDELTAPGK